MNSLLSVFFILVCRLNKTCANIYDLFHHDENLLCIYGSIKQFYGSIKQKYDEMDTKRPLFKNFKL